MRFSFAEAMCDPKQLPVLAKAVEEAGFRAYTIPDSLAYPEVSDSKYPYTPDGDRGFLEDKPFIEPFCLMSALAMVTEQLRFHTFVLKLPIRHPVHTAKLASSVAVLSDNRLSLGVGSSPWPEDYRITDTPWRARGKRMNECMQILRALTAPGADFFAFDGETYQIESLKLCPTPTQPIPLLVGGHSDAALRRAATLGDGWMHAGGDPEELRALIEKLKRFIVEAGRDPGTFEIHVISREAYKPGGIEKLEAMGVTDVILGVRNSYEEDTMPLEHKLVGIQKLAERIVRPNT